MQRHLDAVRRGAAYAPGSHTGYLKIHFFHRQLSMNRDAVAHGAALTVRSGHRHLTKTGCKPGEQDNAVCPDSIVIYQKDFSFPVHPLFSPVCPVYSFVRMFFPPRGFHPLILHPDHSGIFSFLFE